MIRFSARALILFLGLTGGCLLEFGEGRLFNFLEMDIFKLKRSAEPSPHDSKKSFVLRNSALTRK